MKSVIWSDEEIGILKENYGKLRKTEWPLVLPNKNYGQLHNFAYKHGIKAGHIGMLRHIDVVDDFFLLPSTISAYWAGFIAADGSINGKLHQLIITLSVVDINHLYALRSLLAPSANIRIYPHNKARNTQWCKYKINDYCRFQVTSKQILIDLDRIYNITPSKTRTLVPPNLSDDNNIMAYMVGFIDGDGDIRTSGKDIGAPAMIRVCGNKVMMDWICEQANRLFLPRYNTWIARATPKEEHRSDFIYYYGFSAGRATRLMNLIDEHELPVLKRKWDKAYAFWKRA